MRVSTFNNPAAPAAGDQLPITVLYVSNVLYVRWRTSVFIIDLDIVVIIIRLIINICAAWLIWFLFLEVD